MPPMTVHSAAKGEWPAALELLFQQLPPEERHAAGVRTDALLRAGELDPDGLFVAKGSAVIAGAMLCTPAPGAVGLVWPPQVVMGPKASEVEDALVRAALEWLRGKGVKLAQALLRPDEAGQGAALARNGMQNVTTLLYLRHALEEVPADADLRLSFEPYSAENAAAFSETLLRSYEGTLDCTEVNGVRTADEVLAGHRAQGIFDPERWWLVRDAGRSSVGVLLVNALAEEPGWEIIYMGIVPEARGHGLGGQLTAYALRAAREWGAAHVDLCVDCRNSFARRVYEAAGFTPIAERLVLLALLKTTDPCGQL
jgi:mycothiol synthase